MADEDVEWTVDLEVSLFHAMRKHKPVGIPKHFQMTCIQDKLNSSIQRNISAEKIWKHLASMYDLQALDNSEKVPFPNKQIEFHLPKDEFDAIQSKEFPRTEFEGKVEFGSDTTNKDRDRHGSGSSTRGGSKSQQSGTDKGTSEKQLKVSNPALENVEKYAEETPPKRDARKRTRHSLQSPATDGNTPSSTSSTKRQRRI